MVHTRARTHTTHTHTDTHTHSCLIYTHIPATTPNTLRPPLSLSRPILCSPSIIYPSRHPSRSARPPVPRTGPPLRQSRHGPLWRRVRPQRGSCAGRDVAQFFPACPRFGRRTAALHTHDAAPPVPVDADPVRDGGAFTPESVAAHGLGRDPPAGAGAAGVEKRSRNFVKFFFWGGRGGGGGYVGGARAAGG